ncbi:hypothetical protein ABPG75_003394 [Micractinium tetrahymenae]
MLRALGSGGLRPAVSQRMDVCGHASAGSMLARLFGTAAGTPPPPPAAGDVTAAAEQPGSEEERAASLPAEQLAKALLAGNARGQLTTIAAGDPGTEESKVHSSVVSYLSPRGEAPVVLLGAGPQGVQHLANLGESAKASLATGHISPSWFIQRLRSTGWLPRRVALLGSLEPLPAGEVKFAVEQARKACSPAPGLASLLPGNDGTMSGLVGYRLRGITQAVYVDMTGKQHSVAPEELDSCLLDPLALCQHDLLAELNQGEEWQAQLQLFCAAYLGVHASEVLLTQADRLGFTLLGAPAQQAQQAQQGQQRWRQFRIGSARELRGRQQFLELLQQMRAEVAAAAGAA